MNRIETLHVLSGTISTLDDTQLGELYAYAVHMQKRSEPVMTTHEVDAIAGEFAKGLIGLFAPDGEKQAPAPKRIAKRGRPRKTKA